MDFSAQVGTHALAQNFLLGPEPVFPVASVSPASFLEDLKRPYCNPRMKLRNFASRGRTALSGPAFGRSFRSRAALRHFLLSQSRFHLGTFADNGEECVFGQWNSSTERQLGKGAETLVLHPYRRLDFGCLGVSYVWLRASIAALTRFGVSGARRTRAPVASKTALAITAATARLEGSPAPLEGSSG